MVNRLTPKLILAAAAGTVCALAFAPFSYSFIGLLSCTVLFWLWCYASSREAACIGFAFGLGLYLTGTSWVYNSLSVYGGMPVWMASIAVLGFCSLLALFPAMCGFTQAWLIKSAGRRLLYLPFIWVIFEWGKSWVLTGFPWLDLGYSHTVSPLFAYAPLGGVYLVSLVAVSISAVLA